MDVNRSQSSNHLRAQDRYREAMNDNVRRSRSRNQTAREAAAQDVKEQSQSQRLSGSGGSDQARGASQRRDQIDIRSGLSQSGGVLEGPEAPDRPDGPRIARLQEAFRNGTLNSPERVERAAENMLRRSEPEPQPAPEDNRREMRAARRDALIDRFQERRQARRAAAGEGDTGSEAPTAPDNTATQGTIAQREEPVDDPITNTGIQGEIAQREEPADDPITNTGIQGEIAQREEPVDDPITNTGIQGEIGQREEPADDPVTNTGIQGEIGQRTEPEEDAGPTLRDLVAERRQAILDSLREQRQERRADSIEEDEDEVPGLPGSTATQGAVEDRTEVPADPIEREGPTRIDMRVSGQSPLGGDLTA